MLPFKILKEPKLIMFQVKIIHNILPTQSSLFRARITDTDVCPLCNLESQSLKHMLITCSVSSSFWTCFSNWCHEKFNHKLPLSESTILYGWHKESNNWEVLNYCLIVTKYNIFATSVRNGILDFDSFLLRLSKKIDILRTIAFRSNRLSQFKKHGTHFFRYVNASVISLSGLRLFPFNLVCFFCFFNFFPVLLYRYIYYFFRD